MVDFECCRNCNCNEYVERNLPIADLPTLESLNPEHLFMLCTWNSGEGPSKARSPTEGGSGGPTRK